MKIKNTFHSILLLLLFAASGASAFASGYWGIGAGNASLDLRPLYGSEALEDSAMLKFILGSRTDNISLEMDIAVGSFDWVSSRINTHGVAVISANILGYLPLGETFELFAKAGVNTSSTSVDYYGSLYEGDSGFGVSYGAGLMLRLTEKFSLRAEYQVLTGIDDGVDRGDLDWFSIQGVFDF